MRLTPDDPIDPEAGWPGPDIADPWGQPSSRRDHWKRTFFGFFYASALLVGFGLYFIDKNPDGSGRFSGYLIGGGLACLGAGLATMRWVGKERRSGQWG